MPYVVNVTDKASATALASQTICCFTQQKLSGAKTILGKTILREADFKYPVVVPWSSKLDTVTAWNEICAQGMEMFGLPGGRYITDANVTDMTWWFRNEQDALIMTLKFSEQLA
jgi:hypothetical protein